MGDLNAKWVFPRNNSLIPSITVDNTNPLVPTDIESFVVSPNNNAWPVPDPADRTGDAFNPIQFDADPNKLGDYRYSVAVSPQGGGFRDRNGQNATMDTLR